MIPVFIEFFIVSDGVLLKRFYDILSQKVAEGVDVRLIYDDLGSKGTLSYRTKRKFKKAGIKHLFDPQTGDLIYIVKNTNDPLYIDSARQLVKLDLNEAGTEMAAVTYAMAKCGSAPPRPEKKNIFRAERPYVMVLFDRTTNAVLLAGVINNPLKAKN